MGGVFFPSVGRGVSLRSLLQAMAVMMALNTVDGRHGADTIVT